MLKAFLLSSCLLTCTVPLTILQIEPTPSVAQTPPSPSRQPTIGLRSTSEVIDQMCNFLEAQKSFTVDMDITYDQVLDTGSKVQYSAYQKLWVQKPNRLRSDYVGDERDTRFYYDGKTFTLESNDSNFYATKAAPETIDAALDQFEEKYGVNIPMSNLASSELCAYMKSQVQKSIFVGTTMVNRTPMYQILMIGKERDYQIWVTSDQQPLLRKAIITYKTLPGSPQYTVLLSNWNFNPKIPDNTFTFTPPKDAIEIEFVLPQLNNNTSTNSSQ